MRKAYFITLMACFITICITCSYELYIVKKELRDIQAPKFIVSEEPGKIKETLLQAHPYLKVWGPDVLYYWSGIIYDQAQKRHLDWKIIAAKIFCESGFNPDAISDMGAQGISQVLESTAKPISKKMGMTYTPGVTLKNDISCMIVGIQYLDENIKREKSITNGLKSYYAGSGWRQNKKKGPIDDYADNIITEAKYLSRVYTRLYPSEEAYLLGSRD